MQKNQADFRKGTFTEPLNEESDYALDQVWTDKPGTTP